MLIMVSVINSPLLFKNFMDLQQILEIKKNFALGKNPKCKKFENQIWTKRVKLKCSINKKAILHERLFSATLPNKIL